jgi:hypothetical protein
MKNIYNVFKIFLLIIFLILYSCNTTEPTKQNLELGFEDASCTEVWLKVTGEIGSEITLNRDNKEVQKFTLSSSPQTIRNDSLNPNTTYNYRITSNGEESTAEAVTLDTTSHNFTWQTWTFGGQAGSCTLYDVAIINENDIWAVGEIYMLDSLGQPDPLPYNAVHWNGKDWELKRIQFYTFCGQQHTGSYPTKSIFAFNPNDIWIGMDGYRL